MVKQTRGGATETVKTTNWEVQMKHTEKFNQVIKKIEGMRKVLHLDEKCPYCGHPEWECNMCATRLGHTLAIDEVISFLKQMKGGK